MIMKANRWLPLLALVITFTGCTNPQPDSMFLDPSAFQKTMDGKETDLYKLVNANGMEVYVTNFGAVIPAILHPDKDGNLEDIALGFSDVESFAKPSDVSYELPVNEMALQNQLHGGKKGFGEVVWDVGEVTDQSIVLSLSSPDGDMGYPGNLELEVIYTLTDEDALEVVYRATTDAPTVINISQHTYFNLLGEGKGTILDHELMLNADSYTPVNERLIPTGEIAAVEGTPMDFRTPTRIGERVNDDFEQLVFGKGYDHNWVLNMDEDELSLAATLYCEENGRYLEVFTTEPGVQFYCGNFLDGSLTGKSGATYEHRTGLCLETQHFPDTPNQPEFPSAVLRPGEKYYHKTVFKFSHR